MRLLALAPLAVEVSAAGGLGFIGGGNDLDDLDSYLQQAAVLISQNPQLKASYEGTGILPVGFGYLNWTPEAVLEKAVDAVRKWRPAAVWQFGAHKNADYAVWAERIREASNGETKVWVQVCSVADAVDVAIRAKPDVLVVQGTDAGGHGLQAGASIISLLPEIVDALHFHRLADIQLIAAGGITEARGVAAALTLGAQGVCLGTRFLASEEVTISDGYRNEIVRASDGGQSTARTSLYDQLRGTTLWPKTYNGRALLNRSFRDHNSGMNLEENKALYEEAIKQGDAGWGLDGRMTTYAGTGVGLIKSIMKAGDIVRDLQESTGFVMQHAQSLLELKWTS